MLTDSAAISKLQLTSCILALNKGAFRNKKASP